MTSLGPTIFARFDRVPTAATALIDGERRISFGELGALSQRIAGGLARLGVARGDRVAVWMPNLPAWLAVFLACTRLGAVVVAVNTRLGPREVGDLIARSGARLLVSVPRWGRTSYADAFAAIEPAGRGGIEAVVCCADGDFPAAPRVVPLDELAREAPRARDEGRGADGCIVFTTSGTTSRPKLVLHIQQRIARHADDVAAGFGFDAADAVVLQALPLCGVFGFSQAVATLLAGRPLVLLDQFEPAAAAELARRHDVTSFVGTNEMIDRMLDACSETVAFPRLRFFGHANFNPSLTDLPKKAAARGVRLRGLFGMSEVMALYALQPDDADLARRALAGGVPVSRAAVARVRDPESGRIAAPGEPGEIELKGPSLFVEYLGDATASAAALTPDGFFRTGDLGYMTADGGFVLLNRMGDALRLGGFLVNPQEIEDVLRGDPRIAACQVVELARREGMRAVAFVVMAPGATLDEVDAIARCAASLARFKVPVRVVALDAFPTTDGPNGVKVRRGELRELAKRVAT